jgi:hypothetical protein
MSQDITDKGKYSLKNRNVPQLWFTEHVEVGMKLKR